MSTPAVDLNSEQLANLDKEVLIAIIIELRQQMAKQAVSIQELRNQLAKALA